MSPGYDEGRPGAGSGHLVEHDTITVPATSDASLQPQLSFDDVMELVDISTEDGWRDCCDRAIEHLAATGLPFRATDIANLGVGDPVNPNQWGPRLRMAARRGLIERVGYEPSSRPAGRATIVAVWRGVR